MDIFDKKAHSVDIGQRIRELRMEHGLSMRAVARLSGLSANALSHIERGKSSPSVSTLYKIADALEIPITTMFKMEPRGDQIVFRKAVERTRLPFSRGLWEGLGGEDFDGRVEPFMLTLESGASSGPATLEHGGHEFVICLRGKLEYQVENQHFVLEPGDSLLFAAHLRHRWRNPGSIVTNALFVLAGFGESESPVVSHIEHDSNDE
ncbi:helix-turn-helix domain-containing protein [Chloroflexota bacterium]